MGKNKKTFQRTLIKKSGITLIALVVTIVIILILAGISINAIIGDNGLIGKTQEAEKKHNQGARNDQLAITAFGDEIDKWLGGGSGNEDGNNDNNENGAGLQVGEEAPKNTTINGEEPSYNNPIIPEGYTPVNTDGAKWDAEAGPEYNNGLVIEDVDGNQWVWVPVPDPSTMFKETTTTATLCGTTDVTTQYYSSLRLREVEAEVPLTIPGNSEGVREPDLLTDIDTYSEMYKIISSAYTSGEDMARDFVKDYTDMYDSINAYNGFYIGRYELTGTVEEPTLVPGTVLDSETAAISQGYEMEGEAYGGWYCLYKACRNLRPTGNNSVVTTMIWGCQWDETMSWLKNTVFKGQEDEVDVDSNSWGIYDSSNPANTGSSTTYMKNNIYDLAGNYGEWTQEAIDTSYRYLRGGNYFFSGSNQPASSGYVYYPSFIFDYISTRPVLYVK